MKENTENIEIINQDTDPLSDSKVPEILELLNKIIDDKYTLYSDSRIGGRTENQDCYGSLITPSGLLAIVCDGMGGARGGATASYIAVSTIAESVIETEEKSPTKILSEAIKAANQAIYDISCQTPELKGMGTTTVVALISENKATVAHVGDSRVYQIRGKQKVFRTSDHSMVFELVKRGRITEEQARLSAESNVILRALGTKPEVDVEINDNIPYLAGDRFLLCTDGVCGAINEKKLLKYVIKKSDLEDVVGSMLTTIDDIGVQNGGKHDNMTATIVEIKINSKQKVKMTKSIKLAIIALIAILILSLIVNVYHIFSTDGTDDNETIKRIENIILDDNVQDKTKIDSLELLIKEHRK
ncbi:MAG: protein phosphatase 2C domain-containing protein [Rikenellaceae bacterium]